MHRANSGSCLVLVWLILAAVLSVGSILYENALRRRRRRRLASRPVPDEDAWLQQFAMRGLGRRWTFAVCKRLAHRLGCHHTQLRPDDSFRRELNIERFLLLSVDDALEDFVDEDLVEMLGLEDSDASLQSLGECETLGDLIAALQVSADGPSRGDR